MSVSNLLSLLPSVCDWLNIVGVGSINFRLTSFETRMLGCQYQLTGLGQLDQCVCVCVRDGLLEESVRLCDCGV